MALYLHPKQVTDMIKAAEQEKEVIVIRCVRKTAASKVEGPDIGELYDLHCTTKPEYTPKTVANRAAQDKKNGVLTVFAVNRQNKQGGWGDWRMVNIQQVQKVIYKSIEYEVKTTEF